MSTKVCSTSRRWRTGSVATYIDGCVLCQDSIEDWYTTLARNQSQDAPVYFAEKHMWPNFLPVLTWELYPQAKEIFLVRDFRDMVCSILAFDRKRGYPGFGRPEGKSDTDYVRDELQRWPPISYRAGALAASVDTCCATRTSRPSRHAW